MTKLRQRGRVRFLRDFPWLWAIQTSWTGKEFVQVRHHSEFLQIWEQPYMPSCNYRVWAHYICDDGTEGVAEVLPTGAKLNHQISLSMPLAVSWSIHDIVVRTIDPLTTSLIRNRSGRLFWWMS